ncbi:MAG TPA: GH3 auxin-responsive promoter family protein, partial [Bacteroidia bacterium]|nr:GH3 auxin-responsive promoter family protein [Bacteroidia bacterium]
FSRPPADLSYFAEVLDNTLKSLNSDYEAKRYGNHILLPLKIQSVSSGVFHRWLKRKGKEGGQYKIPRLSNERKVLDEILSMQ